MYSDKKAIDRVSTYLEQDEESGGISPKLRHDVQRINAVVLRLDEFE